MDPRKHQRYPEYQGSTFNLAGPAKDPENVLSMLKYTKRSDSIAYSLEVKFCVCIVAKYTRNNILVLWQP